MSKGASRASSLNPEKFLTFIENLVQDNKISDEVFARRFISAIFMAIYNYWAAKQWDSGKRYKGSNQDYIPYTLFIKDMLDRGLDRPIIFIYLRRILADHYVLNPTIINIWDKILPSQKIPVALKPGDVKIALNAAKEILGNIQ